MKSISRNDAKGILVAVLFWNKALSSSGSGLFNL